MRPTRFLILSLSALTLLVPFQNCGKGFSSFSIEKASSSQCKAKMKSEAQKMKWTRDDFRCDDFSSYACERRVFSPNVQTMSHSLTECLPGDRICVSVDVRQFDTSAARGPQSSAADFLPGGSYNHEEVRCYHRWLVNGTVIFEGEKATLEESLSEAISACEKGLEN